MGKRNQKKNQKPCRPVQNTDNAATSGMSCPGTVAQDEQIVVESGEDVILTQMQKRLLEVQSSAIDRLFKAYSVMIELAAVRLECKLSNTRVSGVARELKELIKVMSVYE